MAGNLVSTANSLESVLFYLWGLFVKLFPSLSDTFPVANELFKTMIWLASAAILLVQILRFSGNLNPSTRAFIAVVLFAELLLLVVASSKFYLWYIGMFFPLGTLLEEDHWLSRLTIAISLWELLAFTFVGQTHILNYLLMIVLPAVLIMRAQWEQVMRGLAGDWRASPLSQWTFSLEAASSLSSRCQAAMARHSEVLVS